MVAQNSRLTVTAGEAAVGQVPANVGFASTALNALANGTISPAVAANALTLSIRTLSGAVPTKKNPVFTTFRDPALNSGGQFIEQLDSDIFYTVPAGTQIFANNEPFRLWWCLFRIAAGSFLLAFIRCRSDPTIYPLSEQGVGTTFVLSGAPSGGVFYANSAVSNKPYRIIGFTEWLPNSLGISGNFSLAPDIVQLFGPGIKKPGDIVWLYQNDFAGTTSGAGAGNVIPYDTTVPQDTEGANVLAYTLTPKSPANSVEIDVVHNLARSTAGIVILTLFATGDANSRRTATQSVAADTPTTLRLSRVIPIMAATMTFTARYGVDSAGVTLYLNSNSAGNIFGVGYFGSSLTLKEIMG